MTPVEGITIADPYVGCVMIALINNQVPTSLLKTSIIKYDLTGVGVGVTILPDAQNMTSSSTATAHVAEAVLNMTESEICS
jgi:hypothetical protein